MWLWCISSQGAAEKWLGNREIQRHKDRAEQDWVLCDRPRVCEHNGHQGMMRTVASCIFLSLYSSSSRRLPPPSLLFSLTSPLLWFCCSINQAFCFPSSQFDWSKNQKSNMKSCLSGGFFFQFLIFFLCLQWWKHIIYSRDLMFPLIAHLVRC